MPADTRYAIVGTGNIGSALATLFGRAGVEVRIANTRGPDTITPERPGRDRRRAAGRPGRGFAE
jgi:predicted dinucleotide-binding enzyme